MLKASLSPEGSVTTAASVWGADVSPAKAGRNTASSRAAEALPPAPWAKVTTSSSNRGRRRRNASMRSKTTASRPAEPVSCAVRVTAALLRSVRPAPGSTAAGASAFWASWIRWTLSERTTRQWAMAGLAAMAPPSYPLRPMVSSPRREHSSSPRSTLTESPLVENPTAMSPAVAWAMICRENTRSKPTSLASAVSTARSSTRDMAGRGRPPGGRRKRSTAPSASVALPPLPNAKSRPPRRKRSAIAVAAASSASPHRSRVAVRSARLSVILSRAEPARSTSRLALFRSSDSMNG